MGSSPPRKWTLTHRPVMPSTRRSQVSPAGPAQQRHSASASLSPKLTRSARVLPQDDPVEHESAARSAKRLKTISPPLEKAAVDQDAERATPQIQALEDCEIIKHLEGNGVEALQEHDQGEVPKEEENKQKATTESPAVFIEPEAGAVPSPPISPVPAGTAEIENLADQLLDVSIRTTSKELSSAIADADAEAGKEYVQLHAKFTNAKQQYSGPRHFISPPDLGLSAAGSVGVCRRINLATFVTSLFFRSVGLEELDNYFLFNFLPRGGTLSKLAGSLWIELKTQAFVSTMAGRDPRPQSAILSGLFTEDVRHRLLEARPGTEDLAQSEEDFILDMRSRLNALEADLTEMEPTALAQKYPWNDLLENVVSYISILKLDDRKLTGSERLLLKQRQEPAQQDQEESATQRNSSQGNHPSHPGRVVSFLDKPGESFQHMVARCALEAIQAQGVPFFTHDGHIPYPLVRFSDQLQQEEPTVANRDTTSPADVPSDPTLVNEASIPHGSQTAPTLLLYSRAREASEIEALHPPQSTTDENSKGDRRKWSLEEERALMNGLDRVQGPYWDQILSDEQLKYRTESELKDKARSLKLFFLKTGIEVPYFLKDASKSAVAPKQEDQASAINTPEAEGV